MNQPRRDERAATMARCGARGRAWYRPALLLLGALLAGGSACSTATTAPSASGERSAAPGSAPTPTASAPPPAPAPALFERVHIMGASASAGFGLRPPFSGDHPGRLRPLNLTQIAQAAAVCSNTVTGDATSFFFTNPLEIGKAQVAAVLRSSPRPTIVLAADYLFWFTYGANDAQREPIRDEAQRLELLEVGLANVDHLVKAGIPVVVGDIPDMSATVGIMLSRQQMPELATLERANARIHAWAAERPRVAVVPLATLVQQLNGQEPFDAGGRTWSVERDGPLIQSDRLHPTFVGSVALLASAEQAATERFGGNGCPEGAEGSTPPSQAFEHDPQKVAAAVRARVEADLAAARKPPAVNPVE